MGINAKCKMRKCKMQDRRRGPEDPVQIGIAKRPLEEPHCGDQAGWWARHGATLLCMVDGLGHGRGAEHVAMAALKFVGRHRHEPLRDIVALCDEALRDTRGVAMGLAVVDPRAGALTYAAIGNIRALVVGERNTRLSSNYGIVGGGYRRLTPETVSLAGDELVILATDGVREGGLRRVRLRQRNACGRDAAG